MVFHNFITWIKEPLTWVYLLVASHAVRVNDGLVALGECVTLVVGWGYAFRADRVQDRRYTTSRSSLKHSRV